MASASSDGVAGNDLNEGGITEAAQVGKHHESCIQLSRPETKFTSPCVGQHALMLATKLSDRKSTIHRKLGILPNATGTTPKLHAAAQRPITVMNANAADIFSGRQEKIDKMIHHDMIKLDTISAEEQTLLMKARAEEMAADCEAEMLKNLLQKVSVEQPLSVKVANTDRQREIRFHFHSKVCGIPGEQDRMLIITEHHDGAKYCKDLFGHFVLPNGRLAHFYFHVRSSKCLRQQCWNVYSRKGKLCTKLEAHTEGLPL